MIVWEGPKRRLIAFNESFYYPNEEWVPKSKMGIVFVIDFQNVVCGVVIQMIVTFMVNYTVNGQSL